MKFIFVTVGKQNDSGIDEMITDYTKRISRYVQAEWRILPNSNMEKEGEQILKTASDGEMILLDNRGKELTTVELAGFLEKKMISGSKNIFFVIGGAYGVSDDVFKKANFVWSLSKLTFPHQIARLLLSESIYRAMSVIKKEPYHHE
ncbi:MAG: 23S rRNA (pseudouridine(1915)-N(3))-methyltransferase RlmH [Candidatus Paceibacterota bacterium]|jgi:23S rRNA (pseudouridine1915-N3)-methyltransferase